MNGRDDKDWMREAIKAAESKMPDQTATILFSYPLGTPGNLRYASSINREDAIMLVKQWLFAMGEKEAWMDHIK